MRAGYTTFSGISSETAAPERIRTVRFVLQVARFRSDMYRWRFTRMVRGGAHFRAYVRAWIKNRSLSSIELTPNTIEMRNRRWETNTQSRNCGTNSLRWHSPLQSEKSASNWQRS